MREARRAHRPVRLREGPFAGPAHGCTRPPPSPVPPPADKRPAWPRKPDVPPPARHASRHAPPSGAWHRLMPRQTKSTATRRYRRPSCGASARNNIRMLLSPIYKIGIFLSTIHSHSAKRYRTGFGAQNPQPCRRKTLARFRAASFVLLYNSLGFSDLYGTVVCGKTFVLCQRAYGSGQILQSFPIQLGNCAVTKIGIHGNTGINFRKLPRRQTGRHSDRVADGGERGMLTDQKLRSAVDSIGYLPWISGNNLDMFVPPVICHFNRLIQILHNNNSAIDAERPLGIFSSVFRQ